MILTFHLNIGTVYMDPPAVYKLQRNNHSVDIYDCLYVKMENRQNQYNIIYKHLH